MNLLAIDAGGTHTRCALVSETGQVLGVGESGPGNWTTLGAEAVTRSVADSVAAARQRAGRLLAVRGACVAIAGYYPPWHAGSVANALAPICDCPMQIETDLRAAWAGALGMEPGVVVVAGTGSVAYGEDGRGNVARAGGWGPLAGDEGSGPWIGAAALRAIARAIDGRGPETMLLNAEWRMQNVELGTKAPSSILHSAFSILHSEEWLRSLYRDGWGRLELGRLAPFVAEAAAHGDGVAQGILAEAAAALGELALAVLMRLDLQGARVSPTGGVFAAGESLLAPFRAWLARTAPSVVVAPPQLNPLGGAVLLAMERFGGAAATRRRDALMAHEAFRIPRA